MGFKDELRELDRKLGAREDSVHRASSHAEQASTSIAKTIRDTTEYLRAKGKELPKPAYARQFAFNPPSQYWWIPGDNWVLCSDGSFFAGSSDDKAMLRVLYEPANLVRLPSSVIERGFFGHKEPLPTETSFAVADDGQVYVLYSFVDEATRQWSAVHFQEELTYRLNQVFGVA